MLQVVAEQGDITTWQGDAIIVNLFEGVTSPGGATGAVDKALGGAISRAIKTGDLTGKLGQTLLLYTDEGIGAERVVVVGLGEQDAFELDRVRRATGKAIGALSGREVETVATIVHGAGIGGMDPEPSAQAITEAAISRTYTFERKSGKEDEDDGDEIELAQLAVLERDEGKLAAVQAGVAAGNAIGNAQAIARDIASVSGVEGTATAIAGLVEKAAEGTGLSCTVLGPEAIAEEKMGGLQAVNQGSHEEARFVVLEWAPEGASRTVCIVGKGVTFDTGGISLKRSSGMAKMRYDKGGAAATIGALLAVAQLKLPVRVIGLTPLTDNMPSGTAVKPGDVIRMRSGKTVDVLNTDAEGRLILADALDYAQQFDPDHTVDLATLTGAVSTALGTQAMAVMGNDQALIDALLAAGQESHERAWQLPFYDEYDEQLKGGVGDVKNVGGRNAGCITAGKFLAHFAPEGSWAHLDIAGVAWNEEKPFYNGDYTPKGATGAGVRLLTSWLRTLD